MTRRALIALAIHIRRPALAITMDDVNWRAIPERFRGDGILTALGKTQAALFVTGSNVDNEEGRRILADWNQAGHVLGNHTYSHRMLTSVPAAAFEQDILRNEPLLAPYSRYEKRFRFPALKEGATAGDRDRIRLFLREHNYRTGEVTIDASDWYYDRRLRERLEKEPGFDVNRFRDPYLAHLLDRATYYNELAGKLVRHTLLIHYNALNMLFLGDAIRMFRARGWDAIGAEEAFADPVFKKQPNTLPAGESLIWAIAKESGKTGLRYPGEDDVYEKPKLDRLGL